MHGYLKTTMCVYSYSPSSPPANCEQLSCIQIAGFSSKWKMELSERAVYSLAFTAVQFAAAIVCAGLLSRRHGLSIANGLAVLWYAFDCIVHVTLVSAASSVMHSSMRHSLACSRQHCAQVWCPMSQPHTVAFLCCVLRKDPLCTCP